MAEVILMPKLSDTMTEGEVAEWHKKVGDQVEAIEAVVCPFRVTYWKRGISCFLGSGGV